MKELKARVWLVCIAFLLVCRNAISSDNGYETGHEVANDCVWYNISTTSTVKGNEEVAIWKLCHMNEATEHLLSFDNLRASTFAEVGRYSKTQQFSFVGSEMLRSVINDHIQYSHVYISNEKVSFGYRKLIVNFICCDVHHSDALLKQHRDLNKGLSVLEICSSKSCANENKRCLSTGPSEMTDTMSDINSSEGISGENDSEDIRAALELRERARDLFLHGYNMYIKYAYPWDELKPLSCKPRRWDKRERGTLDDTLGGFALTLIDSLDGLAFMGETDRFKRGIELIKDSVSFERDVTVSLFETTIRVLGGLLSSHMIALKLEENGIDVGYDGHFLLDLATDLGDRLLPAFNTPTGIPYHRVNLKNGVEPRETTRTCSAAAGSLLLEFGTLSRLSGYPKYEKAAKKAVIAIWNRRSTATDLVGNTIDVKSGHWLSNVASTGAGVDSYYEYLWKSHLAFGDEKYKTVFKKAYNAVQREMKFGPWHLEADLHKGGSNLVNGFRVSSLQAFWPGLQVAFGEVAEAEESHKGYYQVWKKYGAMPEVFDVSKRKTTTSGHGNSYYLRPELAESTMMLYQATGDRYYALEVGKRLLDDIEKNTKVNCGFAAIGDVHTGELEDRMDSYILAETMKYLYMLFDLAAGEDLHEVGSWTTWTEDPKNDIVFTTEGHVIFKEMTLRNDTGASKRRKKPSSKTNVRNNNSANSYWATIKLEQMVLASLDEIEYPSPRDLKMTLVSPGAVFAMEAAQANFGQVFDKSKPTQYILVYADPPNACSPLVNSEEISNVLNAANSFRGNLGNKVKAALLVDRGECTYLNKMRNAYAAGARTAFIINSAQSRGYPTRNDRPVHTMFIGSDEVVDSEDEELLMEMNAVMIPNEIRALVRQTPRSLWGGSRALLNASHHVIIELPSKDIKAPIKEARNKNTKDAGLYTVKDVKRGKKTSGAMLDVVNTLISDFLSLGP